MLLSVLHIVMARRPNLDPTAFVRDLPESLALDAKYRKRVRLENDLCDAWSLVKQLESCDTLFASTWHQFDLAVPTGPVVASRHTSSYIAIMKS